jgi:hypothetical protein
MKNTLKLGYHLLTIQHRSIRDRLKHSEPISLGFHAVAEATHTCYVALLALLLSAGGVNPLDALVKIFNRNDVDRRLEVGSSN